VDDDGSLSIVGYCHAKGSWKEHGFIYDQGGSFTGVVRVDDKTVRKTDARLLVQCLGDDAIRITYYFSPRTRSFSLWACFGRNYPYGGYVERSGIYDRLEVTSEP